MLDHPNVIKLLEIYDIEEHIFLVQEFCAGGELFDKIFAQGSLDEVQAANIFLQLVQAVNYCHMNKICH